MRRCTQSISVLYRTFRVRSGVHSQLAAGWMHGHDILSPITTDEERNERSEYIELFSTQCRAEVEIMYRAAMTQLRADSFQNSTDALNALMFLQETIATALWKYHCEVGAELEGFARTHDRLETLDERRRLHSDAQLQRL